MSVASLSQLTASTKSVALQSVGSERQLQELCKFIRTNRTVTVLDMWGMRDLTVELMRSGCQLRDADEAEIRAALSENVTLHYVIFQQDSTFFFVHHNALTSYSCGAKRQYCHDRGL